MPNIAPKKSIVLFIIFPQPSSAVRLSSTNGIPAKASNSTLIVKAWNKFGTNLKLRRFSSQKSISPRTCSRDQSGLAKIISSNDSFFTVPFFAPDPNPENAGPNYSPVPIYFLFHQLSLWKFYLRRQPKRCERQNYSATIKISEWRE